MGSTEQADWSGFLLASLSDPLQVSEALTVREKRCFWNLCDPEENQDIVMCLTSEIPGLGTQSTENVPPFLRRNEQINTNSDRPPECGK